MRDLIEAYRFLALIDADSRPTADLAELVAAFGGPAWPTKLGGVLEKSYHHLLASDRAILMDGGLLYAFRKIYRSSAQDTRRRCNFLMHAAREADLGTISLLIAHARSRRKPSTLPLAQAKPA